MPARIASPEQMRQAVADYVAAVHRAYLAATAGLAPEVVEALPLLASGGFTVLAVAAGDLHLIATAQPLAAVHGREVETAGELGPLCWRLRFYDPVVVPELATITGGAGAETSGEVRRVLGVDAWLYHLVASPSAGLSPHNALHAGAALGHGHARQMEASPGHSALGPGEVLGSGDGSFQAPAKSVPKTEDDLATGEARS